MQSPGAKPEAGHRSVLLHEAIQQLAIQPEDIVVDATLGGAGHATSIARLLSEKGILVGIDLDTDAVVRAKTALEGARPRIVLCKANFRHLARELDRHGIPEITKALFDLGWSSYQLDSGRGFSFLRDEPLVMTYANEGGLTAEQIVNSWEEASIADILWGWGEERYSRRIARAILRERAKRRISSSAQLAEIVKDAVPAGYRRGRIHPATKTFQAIRIAVNDELGALEDGLHGAWQRLRGGGRIAVISFHSIEDRVVKRLFAAWDKRGEGARITRKPLVPSDTETAKNPRSRSAKLRVIEKRADFYEKEHTKDKQIQPLDIPGDD